MNKQCLYCNIEFIDNTKRKNKKFCCNDHWLMNKNSTNGKKDIDYIECPVCKQHVKEITFLHIKKHGYKSLNQFKQDNNLQHTKCKKIRDRMKGKNNPGYNHKGILSPWSKNNIKNTEEILNYNLKKAEKNRKNKRKNELGYWINLGYSKNDAKIEQNKYQSYVNSFSKLTKRSKISIQFFSDLNYQLEYEYKILNQHKNFYVDSIDIKNKKIIEFYGDYWHGNPTKYKEYDNIRGKLVKDKWNEDKERISILQELGYNILIIWEDDYKTDKQKTIKKCIDWLNK